MNVQGTSGVASVAGSAQSVSPTSTVADATPSATTAVTAAAAAKALKASGGTRAQPVGGPPSSGSASASKGLVQTANGEYTAASVAADEKDALALGLTLQKDGNYAAAAAKTVASSKQAAATSSAAVQAALQSLILGG